MTTNPSSTPCLTGPKAKLYIPSHELFRPFDIEEYILKHAIKGEGADFLREAAKAPSRSPNGYRSRTYRYPCPFSGLTITAESGMYEFPFYLVITTRPDVLRVFEQGPLQVVNAKTDAGQPFSFRITVDAVVLTDAGVEIYEIMASSEVAELCQSNPARFQEVGNHKYGSKPAAAYFAQWGFKHFIVTEHDIEGNYVKASDFLRPYRLGIASNPITLLEAETVIHATAKKPGIFVEDISLEPPARRMEVVYHLIAKGEVFTHLSDGNLTDKKSLRLYPTAVQERAFDLLRQTTHAAPKNLSAIRYQLRPGSKLEIAGLEYVVIKVTKRNVELECAWNEEVRRVSHAALLDMKPLIGGIYNAEKTFEARLNEASPEDLLKLLANYQIVKRAENGENANTIGKSARQIRRLKTAYEKGNSTGIALDGLLPKKSGNYTSRLHPKLDRIVYLLIRKYHLSLNHERPRKIFLKLVAINNRFHLGSLPSERAISERCRKLDPYYVALESGGKRKGEPIRPVYPKNELLGSPRGITAWQSAHCDTTPIDVFCREAGTTTRWFLIKMVDGYSGAVLCHCLTKNAPSEDTTRRLLLACVQKHGKLPSMIVFDWGCEGRSKWIRRSMSQLGVTLEFRPKATPRNGANVETMFSTLCKELVHSLQGNTTLLAKTRLVSKATNPRERAVWAPDALDDLLTEYYELSNAAPRYRRNSPDELIRESIERFGEPPTQIADYETFRLALLPFVEKGTRKVSRRGVIFDRRRPYYHDDLRKYAGKRFWTRFDPDDIKRVWVSLPNNRTLECECIDSDIRYRTKEEAIQWHRETMAAIAKGQEEARNNRAEFGYTVIRKQNAQIATRRKEKAKSTATEAPSVTTQPPPPTPNNKLTVLPSFERLF